MEWGEILKSVIQGQGLFGIILTIALSLFAKWLKDKKGIEISKEQLEKAKRNVLAIEELFASGALAGNKKVEAIKRMSINAPDMSLEMIERKIDEAVAVLPNVGATGKTKWEPEEKPINIP